MQALAVAGAAGAACRHCGRTSPASVNVQLCPFLFSPRNRMSHSTHLHQSGRKSCRMAVHNSNVMADVALVNVDYISPSLWLGVAVAMSGLVLYSFKMRNAKGTQELEIVTSSLLVLVGGILTLQGWRLDPILMLSEGVLACVGVYYIVQTVELRKQLLDSYDETYDPRQRSPWQENEFRDARLPGRELPPGDQYAYYQDGQYYEPEDVDYSQYGPPPYTQDEYSRWQAPSRGTDQGAPFAEAPESVPGSAYYDNGRAAYGEQSGLYASMRGEYGAERVEEDSDPSTSPRYRRQQVEWQASDAQFEAQEGRQGGGFVPGAADRGAGGEGTEPRGAFQVRRQVPSDPIPPSQWPRRGGSVAQSGDGREAWGEGWGERAPQEDRDAWSR